MRGMLPIGGSHDGAVSAGGGEDGNQPAAPGEFRPRTGDSRLGPLQREGSSEQAATSTPGHAAAVWGQSGDSASARGRVVAPRYLAALRAALARSASNTDGPAVPDAPIRDPIEAMQRRVTQSNPLGLSLPYRLTALDRLFDSGVSAPRPGAGRSPQAAGFNPVEARAVLLDLVKQQNVAYIDLLEAVDGSPDALARLKSTFGELGLLSRLGPMRQFLNRDGFMGDQAIAHAMLGHMCLDIVLSPDPGISTEARVSALSLMRDHFDERVIAAAMAHRREGAALVADGGDTREFVPPRFREPPTPGKRQTPFWGNPTIDALFSVSTGDGKPALGMSVDEGAVRLLIHYPAEAVQTLVGVLRIDNPHIERTHAFRALIDLTTLSEPRRTQVFGDAASYRSKHIAPDNERSAPSPDASVAAFVPPVFFLDENASTSRAGPTSRLRAAIASINDRESLVKEIGLLRAELARRETTPEDDPLG